MNRRLPTMDLHALLRRATRATANQTVRSHAPYRSVAPALASIAAGQANTSC
jgi:hypothetical protein